ncbi:MAG: hypothetical protein GY755_18855 [Chloroflexi bacterium]|nr:hypothetical protein [Chloroflexota bacterium]
MKNSALSYGLIARFLHWGNAILLILVWLSSNLDDDNVLFYAAHILPGLVALAFTILQAVWFFVDKKPDTLPDLPSWRKKAIDWNHWLIMLVSFLVTTTGVLLWQTDGGEDLHELLSSALVVLFLMHVVGVFLYQFTKGNTLNRMGIKFFDR